MPSSPSDEVGTSPWSSIPRPPTDLVLTSRCSRTASTTPFLELGFVEVSSDGTVFARFDNASLTKEPVGAFGTVNPSAIHGFAGTVRRGYGATFDLSLLRFHDAVRTGQLDLDYVRYVRIIDVVGDGSARDSFGRPIYDPFPTVGTAGFDLDGVAVLETNP